MNIKTFLRLKELYTRLPGFLQRPVASLMYRQSIKRAFNRFLTKDELCDGRLKRELERDIWACRKKYKTKPDEYFLYGFRGMKEEERNTFLPDLVKDSIMNRVVGFDVYTRELRNKFNFYQLAGKWFGRDAMLIGNEFGKDNCLLFQQFSANHPDLFIKNNMLSKGRGTGLYHVDNKEEAERLFSKFNNEGGEWIVEEKIEQADSMRQWNESSVNTVRLPAVLNNGKWTVIGPFFRVGRKGSVVDNAGAGGVFACIDPHTGVLLTDAVDEDGHYYPKHPDSGLSFKGWQIPRWNDLLKIAEEIHRSMPHHKYIGWDFALTENGWILIEGNWGQFVSQYNDHIGLKKQFCTLIGIE